MSKKYNAKNYSYTKKGFLSFQTKQVEHLINDGKYNLAKNILREVLNAYPLDDIALMQWSQILIYERKYLEAKEILESVPIDKSFTMLVSVYQKLEEWDKLKIIYDRYYKEENQLNCKKFGYKQQRIYLSKIFDNYCPIEEDKLTYIDKQFFNYDPDMAIRHIKKNHLYFEGDKSLFVKDFDLDGVFYKVREYIKKHPERGVINNTLLECFMFQYLGCGVGVDSGLYDTFIVKTIINRDYIITMYPESITNNNYDICKFDSLEEEKHPVKIKTGLERFNDRYNKKD